LYKTLDLFPFKVSPDKTPQNFISNSIIQYHNKTTVRNPDFLSWLNLYVTIFITLSVPLSENNCYDYAIN